MTVQHIRVIRTGETSLLPVLAERSRRTKAWRPKSPPADECERQASEAGKHEGARFGNRGGGLKDDIVDTAAEGPARIRWATHGAK